MTLAIAAAIAFVLSLLIVAWTRRLAVLDIPNDRSSHDTPKPRGGGIAIATITIAGAAILVLRVWPFLVAAAAIALFGWIDDVKTLGAGIRFAVQVIAASAVVYVYGAVSPIPLPHSIAAALTIVWIVAVTNAYNFMDGIDGIAGSQAVIAGIVWFAIDESAVSTIALLIVATSLGFLIHNWPPSSIFMGDVGSAFLGFSFAALPLLAPSRRPVLPVVAFIALFPFLFDAAFTLIRRALNRERIWEAHRKHLYQRLVIAGWSHRGVTLLYAGLAVVDGVAALLIDRGASGSYAIAAITLVATCAILLSLTFAAERRRPTLR